MPELPEVETVVRGIKPLIENQTILNAQNFRKNLRIDFPDNFSNRLKNRIVKSVSRRSKYILCELDNLHSIIIHLGMSGKVIIQKEFELKKHDHMVISFANKQNLIFNDPRRFGLVTLIETKELKTHKLFKHLGPEPLTPEFDQHYLQTTLKNKKTNIKNAIMDASIVVGVGNIYASEALFLSAIHPLTKACDLDNVELTKLVESIKIVLRNAIKSGGSTLKDYAKADGSAGYFQHEFKVYDKKDQPCSNCNSSIKLLKISGRSSYYCETCQNI